MKIKQTYGKNVTVEIEVDRGTPERIIKELLFDEAAKIDWSKIEAKDTCPPFVDATEIIKAAEEEKAVARDS